MFHKVVKPKISSTLQGKSNSIIFLGNSGSLKNFYIFNNQNSLLLNMWRDFQKKKKICECQESRSSLKLKARLFGMFKGKVFDFLKKQKSQEERSLKEVEKLKKVVLSENDKATLDFLAGNLKKKLPAKRKKKMMVKLNTETQFNNFLFEVQNAQTVVDLLSEEQKGGILVCEFDFIHLKSKSKKKPIVGTLRFINVEMDKNTKPFVLHLQRQLISKSEQVQKLGKSLEKVVKSNPFKINLLNSEQKPLKKKSTIKSLAAKIAQDDQLSLFGFVQKEVGFLDESKTVLNYMKSIQKNSNYCEKLMGSNIFENKELVSPTKINPDFSLLPMSTPDDIILSSVGRTYHSKTISTRMEPTPQVFSKAISEKFQSSSKMRSEFPLKFSNNSYIKEKIGENKYIYRLNNQFTKVKTMETEPDKLQRLSNDNLQEVGEEEERRTINLSKELVLNSVSQITKQDEPRRTIQIEREDNSFFKAPNQSQKIHNISREFEEFKLEMQRKDQEILSLKEENSRLGLMNQELTSMNQLLKNELDQTMQQIEEFTEIKSRKMEGFEKLNREKFEESLKVKRQEGDIQGLHQQISNLKERILELERELRKEKANLQVELSEKERFENQKISFKMELAQVSDRLNKMINQNTELKIKLRDIKDSSGNQGIEQEMIRKVQELEKTNYETLLKTYKDQTAKLRNDLKHKILETEDLKKELTKGKIDHEKHLDTEKGLKTKISDLKNMNLQLKSKGEDMRKIDSVLGEMRQSETKFEVTERRACINDIETMINSYKSNLTRPRKPARKQSSIH